MGKKRSKRSVYVTPAWLSLPRSPWMAGPGLSTLSASPANFMFNLAPSLSLQVACRACDGLSSLTNDDWRQLPTDKFCDHRAIV